MSKIYLIQECVPHYRTAIFTLLKAHYKDQIEFYAATQNHLGLETVFAKKLRINKTRASKRWGPFIYQQKLDILRKLKPGDVIIITGNIRWLNMYPLFAAKLFKKFKIIWWSHLTPKRGIMIDCFKSFMMSMADSVLFYTDEEIKRYNKSNREKVFATNNTIDTDKIKECVEALKPKSIQKEKQELLGSKNSVVLLFVGRLSPSPKCELEYLIEIMPQLVKSFSDIHLLVVGDGPKLKEYQSQITALGMIDHCHWLGAIYDQKKLAHYFLMADYFVYPGSIGLSMLHALWYGVWVITHDERSSHSPEIYALENGKNGCLFKRNDSADLLKVISKLVESKHYRSYHQSFAWPMKFSIHNMKERFIRCIDYTMEQ